tara:strand:+ start:2124 stop:2858 length:735 start_codon:yes stop_codon:yes gene_type:complete
MNKIKQIQPDSQRIFFTLHAILSGVIILLLGGCESMAASNNPSSKSTSSAATQPEKIVLPGTPGVIPSQGYQNTPNRENIPSSITTEKENISILNAELEQSMTAFDNMLASENTTIEIEEDTMSSDALSDTLSDNNSESMEEATNSSSSSASERPSGAEASNEGENGNGSSSVNNNNNARYQSSIPDQGSLPSGRPDTGTPVDVTDSGSDDIIARQIREAATKEKDPKLQEKLWAEYRKYKQGN